MAPDQRFDALARELIEPLRRFLARRADPATAEDALAETLLVLWRRLDDVPEQPLPWAYAVARNCLANALRGERRQARLAARAASMEQPQVEEGPEVVLGVDDELATALAALPEQDAELLRLWAWEQLEPREIAEVLEITANAVSVRLHRARARLRAQLERVPGEVETPGL
ncbi:sigma-70 family RNA polymerase sigma factor [Nocardioides nanhaiensis]|uniref:Sigma-70 family RNA polymerase sigma factor n=1 Tax=Nocardioides nanhaiensis TaxID=1476871 RepID=A0ABP8VWG0_9ACTN